MTISPQLSVQECMQQSQKNARSLNFLNRKVCARLGSTMNPIPAPSWLLHPIPVRRFIVVGQRNKKTLQVCNTAVLFIFISISDRRNGSRKPARECSQEGREKERPGGMQCYFIVPRIPCKDFSSPCLYAIRTDNVFISIEIKKHHERNRIPACARRYGFDYAREAEKRFIDPSFLRTMTLKNPSSQLTNIYSIWIQRTSARQAMLSNYNDDTRIRPGCCVTPTRCAYPGHLLVLSTAHPFFASLSTLSIGTTFFGNR